VSGKKGAIVSDGRRFLRVLAGIIGGALGALAAVFGSLVVRLMIGRALVAREERRHGETKLSPFGEVQHLSVLPLVDYLAAESDLATEPGVSYLVKADDTLILMDLGLNMRGEHPSPLMRNMQHLGVSPEDIDMVFISYLGADHTGGPDGHELRFSRGPVHLRPVPVFVPGPAQASTDNPEPYVEVVAEPRVLAPGIASTGPMKRAHFLGGTSAEQSLAINVRDKGIVLIVGCGHQRVPRVLRRARELFDEPIHAVIGGLHLPVGETAAEAGRRTEVHPSEPARQTADERDLDEAVEAIEAAHPALVAVSPHDSSELSLERFRSVFGDKYVEMKVGEEIVVQDGHRVR